ncbi:hypothetical protein M758_UG308800 [Ceratodon purpureus]|nr:hypothetical protein M758_UG308800 [Ceratodon purpureus]
MVGDSGVRCRDVVRRGTCVDFLLMLLWFICALVAHLSGSAFRVVDRLLLDRCRRFDREIVGERGEQSAGEELGVGDETSSLVNALREQRRHNFDSVDTASKDCPSRLLLRSEEKTRDAVRVELGSNSNPVRNSRVKCSRVSKFYVVKNGRTNGIYRS